MGSETKRILEILASDELVCASVDAAAQLALPDWMLVSGVLYNAVWNHLDGQPSGYGVKDIDLFYFSKTDLSYAAENEVIERASKLSESLPVPLEVRNQARVHLWFEDHFGFSRSPLSSTRDSVDQFAAKVHSIGLTCDPDGRWVLYAPYGVSDILAMKMVPNRLLDNRQTYETKSARAKKLWPGVIVEDW